MREISYNSKNQGFWLVKAVFLPQLRAPEHLPLLFPISILPVVIHLFTFLHSFIHSFLFSTSTDCLLTVC